ncbi:hypothetical protein ACWC5I_33675 [Kitasatospora sp. NPDC001574]
MYGSTVCTETNRCPVGQRGRCTTAIAVRQPVFEGRVRAELVRIGEPFLDFSHDPDSRTLTFHQPVAMRVRHFLAQALGITVRADREPDDRMRSGKAASGLPLIIPTQENQTCHRADR